MVIRHWVIATNGILERDGDAQAAGPMHNPDDLYRALGYNYLKFFKMDRLSKWAWLAAECLLDADALTIAKDKVAVVMATANGCLDVDERFSETLPMASPALFVYTLPNIMLGEICIRHGFKGEQLCMVSDRPDASELWFAVNDIMSRNGMDACVCGWADSYGDRDTVCLCWVTREGEGTPFIPDAVAGLFGKLV
jgi:3-oxoacyl-(acyl-carrier-protein) synthase